MSGPGRRTICFPFIGDSVGGAHVSTVLLLENLDPHHYEPLVVVHECGPLVDYLERRGIPFEILPLRRYVGRSTDAGHHLLDIGSSLGPVVRFITSRGIDLIHGNDGRINMTWVLPARLTRRPYVWHQRSKFPLSRFMTLFASLASQHIAISEFTRDTMPAALRGHVIHNPFAAPADPSELRRLGRERLLEELAVPPSVKFIAWFGRIVDQKRPAVFVEAARAMLDRFDGELRFVMFGRGSSRAVTQLQAEIDAAGVGRVVHLLGFRSPIEPWISACDVIVVPAVDDAFGRTLVEAAVCGTPVVAARSGGHVEVVRDRLTGLLVEPDKPAAFAGAVLRLLRDPQWARQLADRARADVAEKYSVGAHVQAMSRVYQSLIE